MNKSLLLILSLLIVSCSSNIEKNGDNNRSLRTFDVYDQTLETILENVAAKYEYGLNFNVERNSQKWSLSIHEADINDTLGKISAASGVHFTIDDETITAHESISEMGREIILNLNGNLWKDLRLGGMKSINTKAVENFFGPILKDSQVNDFNEAERTISLTVLPENEEYIRESLSLLNYAKQKRSLVISLNVVKTKDKSLLQSRNIPEGSLKFSWSLNAGDNLNYKLKDGTAVTVKSTSLSNSANLGTKSFELSFTYNGLNSTRVYDDAFTSRKVIKLKDDIYLLINASWYINNNKLKSSVISSDILSKNGTVDYNSLPEKTLPLTGTKTLLQWCNTISDMDVDIKYVQFSKADEINKDLIKINSRTLKGAVKQICTQLSTGFEAHKNGILIDKQLLKQDHAHWTFAPKTSKKYTFSEGAFFTELNGDKVWLLPSANAYLNDKPLKQVKHK